MWHWLLGWLFELSGTSSIWLALRKIRVTIFKLPKGMVYDNQLDFQKMHSIYMPWYHKWVEMWSLICCISYALTDNSENQWSLCIHKSLEEFSLKHLLRFRVKIVFLEYVKLRSFSGSPTRKDLLEYMYDRPLLFKERLWQSKLSDRPRPLPNLQARFRDEL